MKILVLTVGLFFFLLFFLFFKKKIFIYSSQNGASSKTQGSRKLRRGILVSARLQICSTLKNLLNQRFRISNFCPKLCIWNSIAASALISSFFHAHFLPCSDLYRRLSLLWRQTFSVTNAGAIASSRITAWRLASVDNTFRWPTQYSFIHRNRKVNVQSYVAGRLTTRWFGVQCPRYILVSISLVYEPTTVCNQ
jgi:hypothetical protein